MHHPLRLEWELRLATGALQDRTERTKAWRSRLGAARNRRYDADNIVFLHGRLVLLEIADILIIQIDIHEAADLSFIGKEMPAQVAVLRSQAGQRLSHGFSLELYRILLPCVLAQWSWDDHLYGHSHSFVPLKHAYSRKSCFFEE
jgi:hypothetical protein